MLVKTIIYIERDPKTKAIIKNVYVIDSGSAYARVSGVAEIGKGYNIHLRQRLRLMLIKYYNFIEQVIKQLMNAIIW